MSMSFVNLCDFQKFKISNFAKISKIYMLCKIKCKIWIDAHILIDISLNPIIKISLHIDIFVIEKLPKQAKPP